MDIFSAHRECGTSYDQGKIIQNLEKYVVYGHATVTPDKRNAGTEPEIQREGAGIWAVLLVAFFVMTYLVPLEGRMLWQPDETRYAEISREEPDFWHYFFWIEHIQRFAAANAQHQAPFWFYLPVLAFGTLPWQCSNAVRTQIFDANAGINIAFALCAIAALLLAGSDILPGRMVYSIDEWPRILTGMLAFIGWIWRLQGDCWALAALCPLLFNLLMVQIIPQCITDAKQPQQFIRNHKTELMQSRYVLSNHVGIATTLAWELKRSDVLMYDNKGELAYGLTYADAQWRSLS